MDDKKQMTTDEAHKLRLEMVDLFVKIIDIGNKLSMSGHGDKMTSHLIVISNFVIVCLAKIRYEGIYSLVKLIIEKEKERAEMEGDEVTKAIIKDIEGGEEKIH